MKSAGHTEACQHDERGSVVELRGVGHTLVGSVEHLTDEEREEPQTDILNPEDQCVGRTNHLGIDELRHAGPQRGRYEREGSTEDEMVR